MTRLTLIIRAVCWLMWFVPYVLVAAWVGQGEFHYVGARAMAATGAAFWGFFGALAIEATEAPKSLAKSLMEDE
jgi:hypothetical protein